MDDWGWTILQMLLNHTMSKRSDFGRIIALAEVEELEEKIERTDHLIDEIVYDLYGLIDEEIEIIEEAREE
nr:hypothetical protein [Saliphagus infecundisoli]